MDKYDVVLVEMSKLELGENDYLVLKFPDDTNLGVVEEMAHKAKERFPELAGRMMFIAGNVELYVVHREDK